MEAEIADEGFGGLTLLTTTLLAHHILHAREMAVLAHSIINLGVFGGPESIASKPPVVVKADDVAHLFPRAPQV
jgi:hypothetical protein